MKIRNLIVGEELPPELRSGYEVASKCDPNWIWIAEHEGVPVAILVTAPVHVAVFLVRLAAVPYAPSTAVHSLLAHASLESAERGYAGYFTIMDTRFEMEQQLLRIIHGLKGHEMAAPYTLAFGDFKFVKKEVSV